MLRIIIFLLYLECSISLFCNTHNIWLSVAGIISAVCLLPFAENELNIFSRDPHMYQWANEENMINPLYQKGCFRKSRAKIKFLSRLKGRFFCEIVFYGSWFMRLIEIACQGEVQALNTDGIFAGLLIITEIVWMIQQNYYIKVYNSAFRYTEDKNHIWKPFSNMVQYCRGNYQVPYIYYYSVSFEKIEQKLNYECRRQNYALAGEYHSRAVKSAIFWRKTGAVFELLQYGQMQEYSEENMQTLNAFFADFWEKEQEIKEARVKIMEVLCIENENRELRKRLLSQCCVDQKDGEQGRYRLPVIILHSEEPQVKILPLYSTKRGRKEYDEMKKEIYSLLGLSVNDL